MKKKWLKKSAPESCTKNYFQHNHQQYLPQQNEQQQDQQQGLQQNGQLQPGGLQLQRGLSQQPNRQQHWKKLLLQYLRKNQIHVFSAPKLFMVRKRRLQKHQKL